MTEPRKDETPFTIIDGVPRAALAKSLIDTAHTLGDEARSKLASAFRVAVQYVQYPGDNGGYPLPSRVREFIASLTAACDLYATEYDIACRTNQQGHDLLEPAPEIEAPKPVPVAAGRAEEEPDVEDAEAAPPTVAQLRAKVTSRGPWFTVPIGTRPAQCRSCQTIPLFWVTTQNNKKLLVDCDVDGGWRPGAPGELDGQGVAHFATCPQGKMWSKRE